MDHPLQDLCGHLMFTRDGVVWAAWRLQGQAYGRRAVSEKEQIRLLHQMLYRSLGGESLHLGLEVDTDPVQVVTNMLRGLGRPLDQLPEWAGEVEATLDRLQGDLPLSERTYWLLMPLRNTGVSVVGEKARAATTSLLSAVGAPRRAPGTAVLADRLQQAADIQALIPGPFRARPATPAEIAWIYTHSQTRGLARDDTWLPPAPSTAETEQVLTMAETDFGGIEHSLSPGRIPRPILDEGAITDVPATGWQRSMRARLRQLLPSQRKIIKITDADDETSASYQSLAVLAGTPTGGSVFPGTEWLGNAEAAGVPVDWAVRMRNTARETVLARNQRAVKNLNDQFEQREGEVSTGSHELDAVAVALTDYQQRLATDKLEVELETITIFAVSAPTREQALAYGAQLARFYASFDYRLERPLGEQIDAWLAMLPGTRWPTKFKDLAQISLAEGFSAAVPMISSELGDGQGALWAVNETTNAPSPVHIDLFATILANFSAAIAIAGELGSGKSYSLKALAGALVDRGARLVTIDRSQIVEYASFARSLGECTVTAVVANPDAGVAPEYSMDPLRMFDGLDGARITSTLLTPLLSIDANSDVDLALTETTALSYRAAYGLDSLNALTDHLLSPACTVVGATDLGRKLRALRAKEYAAVLFDQTLPALDLFSSRALVFTTYGLQLPTREELLNEHLFKRLSAEKHFGRAMYALLMALSRAVAFADPNELVFFVCDECHHITASIEGEQELETFIREGRKNGAAAGLGSQDCANDFGNQTLRGLIPYRLIMRLTDENLARKALEWIGLEPTVEHLAEITGELSPRDMTDPDGKVAPERRGEGIFRDSYRRIGRVRILGPALPARREAYSTTPRARAVASLALTKPSTGSSSRPAAAPTTPTTPAVPASDPAPSTGTTTTSALTPATPTTRPESATKTSPPSRSRSTSTSRTSASPRSRMTSGSRTTSAPTPDQAQPASAEVLSPAAQAVQVLDGAVPTFPPSRRRRPASGASTSDRGGEGA